MVKQQRINSVKPLHPDGHNSTMFTGCCSVAITSSETVCPHCNELVIGWDADTTHEREQVRWAAATKGWKR